MQPGVELYAPGRPGLGIAPQMLAIDFCVGSNALGLLRRRLSMSPGEQFPYFS